MLRAIRSDDNAHDAFDVLGTTLAKTGTAIEARGGLQRWLRRCRGHLASRGQMWSLLRADQLEGRFCVVFGIDDPRKVASLDIAVEINLGTREQT